MSPRLVTALVLACAALALSGCGFRPLYAQPGVTPGLADILVAAPRGRAGYLVGEALNDALATGGGASAWRLDLDLSEQRFPRGLRVDNVATRYEYVLTAAYTLRDVATLTPAKVGNVRVELTYDSADQPYASVAAQQDAQERAALEAARRIQLELAAWFADQAGS
ncbi:MAG: LPS assembly lipoprotein LptE [Phenylobacterium sp.]|uniref:LPS assembly lipoprotein LptE n=1 Tax=Phenylobacterium sp. TaxID=1871053 RepID=UPI002719ECE0|nr:LPS assembly lipoprotein LptE [Phenylobacterium sp.]MDO8900265.1 LPS assembly lipoprotein LptE [Phenylobacterium sp.]MDP2215499.1 LPS assembly lipoprotein LptE [Phenylobacterium sp.]